MSATTSQLDQAIMSAVLLSGKENRQSFAKPVLRPSKMRNEPLAGSCFLRKANGFGEALSVASPNL
jgi:hypothetical protein